MYSFIGLVFAALLLVGTVQYVRVLSANIAKAKQSGLPYTVTPVYGFNRLYLITHRIWLRLLYKLPDSWTHPWITYADCLQTSVHIY